MAFSRSNNDIQHRLVNAQISSLRCFAVHSTGYE